MVQYVDPEVTRVKFKKELKLFNDNANEYKKKGIICIGTGDLSIDLIFAVPHLKPQPIAFSVRIDYTNWDAEPPSITFIEPFTGKNLKRKDIKINFFQATNKKDLKEFLENMKKRKTSSKSILPAIDLLQDNNPPFLCIPGVKEYHNHAAHSGDSWMRHRTNGEGQLCVLIGQLYKHSIAQAFGYQLNANVPKIPPGVVPEMVIISTNIKELNISTDFNRL